MSSAIASLTDGACSSQTDPLLKLDNRPASLVLVAGPDTQALYNFLLNSRAVMTSVGPLADIPPTILAPVAFKGATLNSCKVCCYSKVFLLLKLCIRMRRAPTNYP